MVKTQTQRNKNTKNTHFSSKYTCLFAKNVVSLQRICKMQITINYLY